MKDELERIAKETVLVISDTIPEFGDYGRRAVYGMNSFRPLEHWVCGFESHSMHGFLCR